MYETKIQSVKDWVLCTINSMLYWIQSFSSVEVIWIKYNCKPSLKFPWLVSHYQLLLRRSSRYTYCLALDSTLYFYTVIYFTGFFFFLFFFFSCLLAFHPAFQGCLIFAGLEGSTPARKQLSDRVVVSGLTNPLQTSSPLTYSLLLDLTIGFFLSNTF